MEASMVPAWEKTLYGTEEVASATAGDLAWTARSIWPVPGCCDFMLYDNGPLVSDRLVGGSFTSDCGNWLVPKWSNEWCRRWQCLQFNVLGQFTVECLIDKQLRQNGLVLRKSNRPWTVNWRNAMQFRIEWVDPHSGHAWPCFECAWKLRTFDAAKVEAGAELLATPTLLEDSMIWNVLVRNSRNLETLGKDFSVPISFSHSRIVGFESFGTNKCNNMGSQLIMETFKLARLCRHSLIVSTIFLYAVIDSVLMVGREVSLDRRTSTISRGFSYRSDNNSHAAL